MAHTPGRGHRRKSNPAKKRRFRRKATSKRFETKQRNEAAKRAWDEMSEEARRLRPELNPETMKPDRD